MYRREDKKVCLPSNSVFALGCSHMLQFDARQHTVVLVCITGSKSSCMTQHESVSWPSAVLARSRTRATQTVADLPVRVIMTLNVRMQRTDA